MSHVKLVYDAEKGVMVPRQGDAGAAQARAARICYVDDSRTSSYVTLKILRQYGYQVDAFHTGEEALEALMERDYDLLLTDLVLSHGEGMNGDDLVRVLRQCGLPGKADLPAVVITGDQEGGRSEALHEAGADEVLVKPLKGKELNQVLRRLLAGPAATPVLERPVGRGETPAGDANAAEEGGVVTQVIDGFEDFSDRPSIFSELEDPLKARQPARPQRPENPFLEEDELLAPPSPPRTPPTPPAPEIDFEVRETKREARGEVPPVQTPSVQTPPDPTPPRAAPRETPAPGRREPPPQAPPQETQAGKAEPARRPPIPAPEGEGSEDSLLSLLEDFDEGADSGAPPPPRVRRALGIPLLLLLLALVGATAGYGAWAWWQGRTPEVVLAEVSSGPIYQSVHAAGRVVSDRFVDVTSHGPGQLVAVEVKEGDRVEAGQLLARMDDQDARMRLKRIEARLISLEEEVSRANKIRERLRQAFQVGAVSRQALDDAEADWTAASARHAVAQEELAAAKLELERTRIKAPFAGVVTEVKAHAGQWVSPPQPILRLVDDRRTVVQLRVDAADSARLAPGQTVVLSSEAFPDRSWQERVLRIAPSTEANVVEVEVSLGRNAPSLRLGQPVSGEIRIQGRERAVKLPLEALVEGPEGTAVMVLRDGRIHFQKIETGIEDFTHVEVRAGLQAGDLVVLPRGRTYREGQPVEVAGRAG